MVLASLALLGGARADDVVEMFPDGAPKLRYAVDAEGRKHGHYVEYHEGGKVALDAYYKQDRLDGSFASYFASGKPRVRTAYRGDRIAGKYEEWAEDGSPLRSATYVDGRLDGKFEAFRGKTTVSTQVWKDGVLVTWNAVAAFPREREAVESALAAIEAGEPAASGAGGAAKPKPKPADAAPPAAAIDADRERALRRLKAFRYLCEVAYADVTLDDEANASAQAAAEICAKLGQISHAPPNPGLPDAEYRVAAKAAASCNLHQTATMAESVDGYMDDSDESNIGLLGHRRWCLNPAMRRTGFGLAHAPDGGPFTAMWAMDDSRTQVPDFAAVCFPARGWNPAAMFSGQHAWSVSWNPSRFPHAGPSTIRVEVRRLGEDFVPAEEPLPLDSVAVNTDGFGGLPCLIFRPKGVTLGDGAAYAVEVSGLADGAKANKLGEGVIRYVVRFFAK